jgi:hypothetical protein
VGRGHCPVIFFGAGFAALMGWIPGSVRKPAEASLAAKSDRARSVAKAAPAAKTPVVAICSECGVVQSVHEIDTKGKGSGIGAVGGAVVGNAIEKHVTSGKSYEISVRFEDGSSRVVTEHDATAWRAGDKVKVLNGVIHSNA